MDATDFLRLACLTIPAATLLTAAVIHLRDLPRLHAIMVAQRILPYRVTRVGSSALGLTELAVGLTGCASVAASLAGSDALHVWLAIPQTILLWIFAGYISLLLVRGRAVPCGCFGGSGPATVLTLFRGIALGGMSLGGLII